jgi:hypothetical protein
VRRAPPQQATATYAPLPPPPFTHPPTLTAPKLPNASLRRQPGAGRMCCTPELGVGWYAESELQVTDAPPPMRPPSPVLPREHSIASMARRATLAAALDGPAGSAAVAAVAAEAAALLHRKQLPTLLRDMGKLGGGGGPARALHDALAGSGLQSSHSVRVVVDALLLRAGEGATPAAAVAAAAEVLLAVRDAELLHAGAFQVRRVERSRSASGSWGRPTERSASPA